MTHSTTFSMSVSHRRLAELAYLHPLLCPLQLRSGHPRSCFPLLAPAPYERRPKRLSSPTWHIKITILGACIHTLRFRCSCVKLFQKINKHDTARLVASLLTGRVHGPATTHGMYLITSERNLISSPAHQYTSSSNQTASSPSRSDIVSA